MADYEYIRGRYCTNCFTWSMGDAGKCISCGQLLFREQDPKDMKKRIEELQEAAKNN